MAFVLLSHLSPTHHSELARLLATATRMSVRDAADGESPKPNCVYVLPSDKRMTIAGGLLRLTGRDGSDGRPTIIDDFFESLAADQGNSAVGVVLSGTGSDGTAGALAIRANGGMTYAQDPALSAYDGMPRSAIEANAVEFTLPLEGIAQAIGILDQPDQASRPARASIQKAPGDQDDAPDADSQVPPLSASEAQAMEEIVTILRTTSGVAFQHYKRPSLVRRVRRRAADAGLPDLTEYLVRLRQDPVEAKALFQSVLIQVTRFFRESGTFEVLKHEVIPALAAGRTGGSIRAWVIGCATGEEAYSLAIAFLEAEAALGVDLPARIFASDVSEPALATARLAQFPDAITADVSTKRLERFFAPVEHGYQVNKRVREMCVFARHDITRDPPFAQLDLVLCCNVLIYLDPVLQRRLLQNMHYALKPGGYLALGPAETTTGVEGLFSPSDRKHKIYVRRPGPARIQVSHDGVRTKQPLGVPDLPPTSGTRLQWTSAEVLRSAERTFFAEYPSASVIINQDFNVLHYQGPTAPWLEMPTGGPTSQLLRLAHPDLQFVLGRLLRRARKERAPVRRAGVVVAAGKRARRVNLSVLPVPLDDGDEQYFLVVFDAVADEASSAPGRKQGTASVRSAARIRELESELADNKEYLQTFIDQQDAAHAELQATYEESLSVNEEYQSTNEELESAKEELQSLNEELSTLNEQLQQRNAEVQLRSAEMSGLLEALDMPLVLLTRDLRLRAYNARAASDFHFTAAQVGREIGDSSLPISPANLGELVERAFAAAETVEQEILGPRGMWQALRIWPIHAVDESGTVAIAFVDIGKLKQEVATEQATVTYKDAIVDTIMEPLVVLDDHNVMVHANEAFHRAFGTDSASLGRLKISELGEPEAGDVPLDEFLSRSREAKGPVQGPEISLASTQHGSRIFRLSAGPVNWQGPPRVVLALEDVTERKRAEHAAQETARMMAIGQLAGGVAHEINNQMTVIQGLADYLLKDTPDNDARRPDIREISRAAIRSATISKQLLAFSRRQPLNPVVLELNTLIATSESLLHRILGSGITLELSLGELVGAIRVDQAQLEQLLVNLVVNARDAMDGAGRLRIETGEVVVAEHGASVPAAAAVPAGTYARLIVSDTGKGMDAATAARIFEPFFTTKPVGQGTGLGLASVYGIVKQSGGLIWVDSEPGRGTSFTIDLPQVVAAQAPAPPVGVPTATVASAAADGSISILLVDDEAMVRHVTGRALRELGYAVIEASDGREALRLISEEHAAVDLVLSDVVMPGMSGAELWNRLAESHPGLPVLLMSGYASEDLVRQGRLAAGTPVLAKPFTVAELSSRINSLLRHRA